MMDIKHYIEAADKTETLELLDPASGEPCGVLIELYGSDSSVFRSAINSIGNKRMKSGKKATSAEDIYNDSISLLASCTASWEGFEEGAEELKCTKENAERIYKNIPWVKEQVDEFIGERANFIKKQSSN